MFIIISRFDCNPLHFAYFLSDSQSPFSSSSCLVAPLLLCFSFLMLWMAPACGHNYLPIVWNHFSNSFCQSTVIIVRVEFVPWFFYCNELCMHLYSPKFLPLFCDCFGCPNFDIVLLFPITWRLLAIELGGYVSEGTNMAFPKLSRSFLLIRYQWISKNYVKFQCWRYKNFLFMALDSFSSGTSCL